MSRSAGYVEALGRRYECVWHGAAQAGSTTLVLMHEGLGSATMWGRFPGQLHEATGLPIFAFSRKGYGSSDDDTAPRAADFMHLEAWNDLPAVLEAAGIGRFWLVGHSDGGSISVIYAGSPEYRSAQLEGLILMAAHVFNEPVCIAGIEAAAAAYRTTGLRDALTRYHGDRVDAVFESWRDIWLAPQFEHLNIEKYLARIRCPVLVVQGRDDPYGTLDQVTAIEAGVSAPVETAVLETCGHSPHRDQPEATRQRIVRFLGAGF